MGWRRGAVTIPGVVLCLALGASGQTSDDAAAVRPAQLQFVRDYVAAMRSKDVQRAVTVLHPKYRACINQETQAFFDFFLVHTMRDQPTTDFKVEKITPVDAKQAAMRAAFLPADGFAYPVNPRYTIQVDFEPTNNGTSLYSAVLDVAPEGDSWYLVGPCPNAKGMEFFRQRMEEGRRQRGEAKRLAAELKDPLLSQLQSLLKSGDRVGAIKEYSKQTGADLTTAVQVIEVLQGSDGN